MFGVVDILQRALEPLPVRGKGRIADRILRRAKIEELTCHPLRGLNVQLRRSQRIERLMWAGAYEREVVSLLKKKIEPSMTVLDIGANIGYIAAIAAELVGGSGTVHAFEPNPGCFARLLQNLKPFAHAHAHQLAIGEEDGMLPLYLSENSAEDGWASLLNDPGAHRRALQVRVANIDGLVSRSIARRVDVIKLDIEGNELHALRGAQQTIERDHPMIIAELNPTCLARDGTRPADVFEFLAHQGYSVHYLDGENIYAA
jgi:FkbM family methyltransferase